jgi:ribosome-associated toxin RatA of RatAB toxin-antitoxin module
MHDESEKSGSRSTTIAVPIDFFWGLITDYARYPEMLDEMKDVRVLSRSGNEVTVAFSARVMLKSFTYTLRLVEERPNRLSWSLIESDTLSVSNGGWVLEALGPTTTRAHYTAELRAKIWLPKAFLNALTTLSLPAMLRHWSRYAEARYAEGRRP